MAKDSQKNKGKNPRTVNINRRPRQPGPEMDRCDGCRREVYANMLTPQRMPNGKFRDVCGQCL